MNKYLSAAFAASLLALPPLARAGDPSLSTDKDKVSYSMGVDMGRNLQNKGIDVDPDILAQGLKDAVSGGPLKMTDAEMQSTMTAFIQGIRTKMEDQQKAAGATNKTKGEQYLADNKKKDGWKVTSSGLQYKIITTGTGEKPKPTDTVVTNYRGTTIDGVEFDSSYKRNQPAEFPVNAVIPGWTEALQLMPVGYGENGPPPIGPNSVLLFDIELLAIKAPGASPSPGAATQ
jgi:FKBP-type peptidyl-prolyl cis-trans isomerase